MEHLPNEIKLRLLEDEEAASEGQWKTFLALSSVTKGFRACYHRYEQGLLAESLCSAARDVPDFRWLPVMILGNIDVSIDRLGVRMDALTLEDYCVAPVTNDFEEGGGEDEESELKDSTPGNDDPLYSWNERRITPKLLAQITERYLALDLTITSESRSSLPEVNDMKRAVGAYRRLVRFTDYCISKAAIGTESLEGGWGPEDAASWADELSNPIWTSRNPNIWTDLCYECLLQWTKYCPAHLEMLPLPDCLQVYAETYQPPHGYRQPWKMMFNFLEHDIFQCIKENRMQFEHLANGLEENDGTKEAFQPRPCNPDCTFSIEHMKPWSSIYDNLFAGYFVQHFMEMSEVSASMNQLRTDRNFNWLLWVVLEDEVSEKRRLEGFLELFRQTFDGDYIQSSRESVSHHENDFRDGYKPSVYTNRKGCL